MPKILHASVFLTYVSKRWNQILQTFLTHLWVHYLKQGAQVAMQIKCTVFFVIQFVPPRERVWIFNMR